MRSRNCASSRPRQGEETALATRRTTMMQAEKVADDLRDAHTAVAGQNSPVAGILRRGAPAGAPQGAGAGPDRTGRESTRCALNAIEEARSNLERALAAADHDPAELERIEERLFALRAAGRKYAVPVDNLAALARTPGRRPRTDRCRRGTNSSRWKRPRGRARGVSTRRRRNCRTSARRSPKNSTRQSMPNSSR